jgi:peptide chain release factor 2
VIAVTISGGIFDFDDKSERLIEVTRELESPNVWDDPERAQKLGQERASLEKIVSTLSKHRDILDDAQDLLELSAEENDQDTFDAVLADLDELEKGLEKLEFQRMFSGAQDKNSAYLDIQAGSGGTEAQDWANILLRMYLPGVKITTTKLS